MLPLTSASYGTIFAYVPTCRCPIECHITLSLFVSFHTYRFRTFHSTRDHRFISAADGTMSSEVDFASDAVENRRSGRPCPEGYCFQLNLKFSPKATVFQLHGNSRVIWDHTHFYVPPDRGDVPNKPKPKLVLEYIDPEGTKG